MPSHALGVIEQAQRELGAAQRDNDAAMSTAMAMQDEETLQGLSDLPYNPDQMQLTLEQIKDHLTAQ
jgi:hypothetical protein